MTPVLTLTCNWSPSACVCSHEHSHRYDESVSTVDGPCLIKERGSLEEAGDVSAVFFSMCSTGMTVFMTPLDFRYTETMVCLLDARTRVV